jgi:hypothetical protein
MKVARMLPAIAILIGTMLISAAALLAFSIFANGSGVFRKYPNANIPFIYRLNGRTPASYYEPIRRGAEVWNQVSSSY